MADRLTFDLDPGADLPYAPLRDAAYAVRKLLQDLGLESWVKTTGGKGLHVVAPLAGNPCPTGTPPRNSRAASRCSWSSSRPTMFTSKTGERNRKNKIFVDYLRNGFGATAVAAFSPRWRPGVGVSTPVAWEEIDDDIRGTHFNLHNVPERVAKQRKDPWKGYWSSTQALTKAMIDADVREAALKHRLLGEAISRCGTRCRRASPPCRAARSRRRHPTACSAAR